MAEARLPALTHSAHTTPVTSQFGERTTHQVFDQHTGDVADRLPTVCGRWIVPAPMVAPLGMPCPVCVALVPARPVGGASRGRERRWRKLLRARG